MNTDDILTFGVNKNQRHAGRLSVDRTHRRNIDTIALQLAANAFADIVITGTGNKRNIRAASPGGDGLVSPFTAESHLIMMTGDGFARRRERFKVKNVIGIDAAKDDKFACGFHYFCSRESAPPDSGGACPAFLFYIVPRIVSEPNRILLLNDQLQLNRIAGIHFLTLQHFISSLHAFHADLLWQLSDGRCQFATIYGFFAIRSTVKSNHHHIGFACRL